MQAAAQLQGIVGPQIYQEKFGPDYKVSFSCSIGLIAGAIASIAVTWFIVARRDRAGFKEAVAEEWKEDADRI